MPTYCLKCRNCHHEWDHIGRMSEDRSAVPCPECGTDKAWRDFAREGAPAVEREWSGREAVSLKFAFDPNSKEIRRECPSIRLNRAGHVLWKSDRHQKKVYREMQAALDRYNEEERERLDRRRANAKDIRAAAGAIRQFNQARSNAHG